MIIKNDEAGLQQFVGRTIVAVTKTECDEGVILHFSDGSSLDIGFSGNEGRILVTEPWGE